MFINAHLRVQRILDTENILGGNDENLDFSLLPNTRAYFSCSAKLNGEMFVFGGDGNYQTQVK